MLEWLSWKSKSDAVLPIPISLLPDLIFAALAGSFLSDHLRETALSGALSIPPLSEIISRICLPLYRPSASLWSSLQLESRFHIFCPWEPYSFPSVSICLLNFPPQPPQTSLYLLPLPSGSSPPPVPLVLKNYPYSVYTSDLYCIMLPPTESARLHFITPALAQMGSPFNPHYF